MNKYGNRMLCKINGLQKMEKAKLVMVSFLFVSMALTPMIMNQTAHAAGGLKVNVHVNSAGHICVLSSGEDLGCKSSNGPDVVQFQFGKGVVEEGDTFQACFNGNCVTGTNGPKSAPEDVYLSSGTNNPLNEFPQRIDGDIVKTLSTSDPDLSISSVSDYTQGNYFYIVGEVKNNGISAKHLVKISITLYNDLDTVIGTTIAYTNPSDIPSGGSSPFKFMIGNTDVTDLGAIKNYKLLVSSS